MESTVFVGTLEPSQNPDASNASGLYRCGPRQIDWEHLQNGLPGGLKVFSILPHPDDPATIYAGMDHTIIYKTEDGGGNWRRLPTIQPEAALPGAFPVRVLRMALDPSAPDEVYAALEVGGETWNAPPLPPGIVDVRAVHCI